MRARSRSKLTIPKVLACTVLAIGVASCDPEEHPIFCTSDGRDAGAGVDAATCPNAFVENEADCPEGCITEVV